MRLLIFLAFTFFLSLEASAGQSFRQMAADAIASELLDPFSVKKAMVSPPYQYKKAVVVCAKFYAKNRVGAYTGLSIWSVVFTKDGSRVKFAHNVTGKFSDCEKSTFSKFPELENW